jgi:hypothetical protein
MKPYLLPAIMLSALVAVGCGKTENKPVTASPSPAVSNVPAPSTPELPPGHPPIGQSSEPGLPAGHPPIDMAGQNLPAETLSSSGNPKWTVPADWKAGRTSNVRRGSFVVSGPEGQSADIAVTVFPGDVGGPLANLNRWRGQIGLEPLAAEKAPGTQTKLTVDGIESRLDDMVNPAEGKAMIVVTVPKDGSSWFFKMTGDAAVVAAQRDALIKFVESVKF